MVIRTVIMGAAGVLLALDLGPGAGAAVARTTPPPLPAPLQGVIQGLSRGSFQVNTGRVLTRVRFTTRTRVMRVVSGSTADLTRGARVDLRFGPDGGVTAIRVAPSWPRERKDTKPDGDGPRGAYPEKSPTGTGPVKPEGTVPAPHKRPRHGQRAWTQVRGQVAGFNAGSGTLTLGGPAHRTVTYVVRGNVIVTKMVAGTTNDLANGETVQVFAPVGGPATFISILSA